MASLKDIKRRIRSVKSTQKITNAMKLVSASKFSRATHAVQASRPYGKGLDRMVANILAAGSGDGQLSSDLIGKKDGRRVLIVVVGSDRGLCGALNTNLFKKVDSSIKELGAQDKEVLCLGWGRRPQQYCRKVGLSLDIGEEKVLTDTSYQQAVRLSDVLVNEFRTKEFSEVYLAYSRFKSAVEQTPTVTKVLPFIASDHESEPVAGSSIDFVIEPKPELVVERLIQRWLVSTVHRVLLESAASEHGARMSAMDNATNNAKEVQKKLTLVYNRARQAAITTELTEIISGAEAL